VIILLKILDGVLRFGGYIAIIGLAGVVAGANYGLGLAMIGSLFALILLRMFCSSFVRTIHLRSELVGRPTRGPAWTFSMQESETYECDAETLFELIRPAESAVLLSDAKRAFTVPGTPDGVGEQQCFIGENGCVSIIEVMAEERPWGAHTRIVTHSQVDSRSSYEIEPLGSGCTLTIGIAFEMPAGLRLSKKQQAKWRESTRHYLTRAKQVLAVQNEFQKVADPLKGGPAQEK
jgi:hypothetical protein